MGMELVKTDGLKGFLMTNIKSLQEVAAEQIGPERMVRLVCMAATRQPDLAECTPMSILRAMMDAASLGLEVCTGANEGYLVPYSVKVKIRDADGIVRETWQKQATFQPGYQGMVKKAVEGGSVRNIEAHIVYTKDVFDYEYGTTPFLKHKPALGADRGEAKAAYAIAFLMTGGFMFEVMDIAEVNIIRDRALKKARGGFSPWTSDYSEMVRKTAVRRIYKYLPKTKAMADIAAIVDRQDEGAAPVDVEPEVETQRPGDAGEAEIVQDGWSDEERESAKAAYSEMCEALLEKGMAEADMLDLMKNLRETMDVDVAYGTWTSRLLEHRKRHVENTGKKDKVPAPEAPPPAPEPPPPPRRPRRTTTTAHPLRRLLRAPRPRNRPSPQSPSRSRDPGNWPWSPRASALNGTTPRRNSRTPGFWPSRCATS